MGRWAQRRRASSGPAAAAVAPTPTGAIKTGLRTVTIEFDADVVVSGPGTIGAQPTITCGAQTCDAWVDDDGPIGFTCRFPLAVTVGQTFTISAQPPFVVTPLTLPLSVVVS